MVRKVVSMAVDSKEVVKSHVAFENDTIYPVIIVDHDGTRTLDPGQSQKSYLVNGFNVDLTLKLSDANEAKKNFPAEEVEDRTLKMSKIFADHIMDLNRSYARDGAEQKFNSKSRKLIVNITIFYRSGPLIEKCGSFTSITIVSSLSCPGKAKNVWNLAVTSTRIKDTDLRIE